MEKKEQGSILIGDAPPAAKPLEGWSIILPIRVAFDGDEVEKIESNRIEAERERAGSESVGERRDRLTIRGGD